MGVINFVLLTTTLGRAPQPVRIGRSPIAQARSGCSAIPRVTATPAVRG